MLAPSRILAQKNGWFEVNAQRSSGQVPASRVHVQLVRHYVGAVVHSGCLASCWQSHAATHAAMPRLLH